MYQARRQPVGSTAGWRVRPNCWRSTPTARDATPSLLTRSPVAISRLPTTCAFEHPIPRPSFGNYTKFPGQVGTMTSARGACRFGPMRNCGADGRQSKRLPNVANPRKGSDDERRRRTRRLKEPHGCDMRNAAANAIRCRLKTCLRWAAPSQQSSTASSSLPMCQAKSPSRQYWPPSIHMRRGRTSITCGERGARRR